MFGKRIVELRKKLKLTQTELATSIGISRSALSLYEIEKREPDIDTLNKLASLFQVSVDYILGNEQYTINYADQKIDVLEKEGEKDAHFFFFFFDDMLKDIFVKRLQASMDNNNLSLLELSNRTSIDIDDCKAYLVGKQEPSLEHLINLSRELDISIDYLLGQVPQITAIEKKLLNAFVKLNEDNQDIIIGKIKELLKEQKFESVAAESNLGKTGTDNQKGK